MRTYGSDKPDLRFGLEFKDVTAICAQSPRNVVANGAKAPGGIAVAMTIPGGSEISGTQLRKFEDVVKQAGAGGLSFFKVGAADREKQQVMPLSCCCATWTSSWAIRVCPSGRSGAKAPWAKATSLP